MAIAAERHPANADGAWFVDRRCINCDACRQLAPDVFADVGDQSVVSRQPLGDDEERAAWRAALTCPTRSIGVSAPRPRAPGGLLPAEVADDVYLCGHNSQHSFGANSFFVRRPAGNLLVDSPRWTRQLAEPFEAMGGVDHVLLTHRDDVADADRWAARFGARVWIHEADRRAAPYATDVLGDDDTEIAPGLVAVALPGHTRGSVAFVLEQRFLFSGDSLYWNRARGDLGAHEHATWFSWAEQARSLRRLADGHRFEWVLAGHGDRARRPAAEMHERLVALTARMRRTA